MTSFKYVSKGLRLILLSIILALFILPSSVHSGAQDKKSNCITTRAELMKALADKQETIYVGDMFFDEKDIPIEIKQSVRIIGVEPCATLNKAHFQIIGSELESEFISVSFENIIFNGCYEYPAGSPENAASFADFHGDRTDMGCICASDNIDLKLHNCTIRDYCAQYGAAIYLHYTDGNKDLGRRAGISIKSCRFLYNTCERGVLWCNGKKTLFEMSDTEFLNNRAYTGIVVLGGINGLLENVAIKDNERVKFAEKNTFVKGGGGIAIANSEAVIKNCLIDGCSAPNGGGILSAGTILTIDSCQITNNNADTFGGGMVLHSGENAPVYVTNTLISGNSAEQEGAAWVYPADQIGIGLPTGIVEFSFCTFEDNTSPDMEHLSFHPIMLENEGATIGRDGKVDFIACRVMDPAVAPALKNGENYNVVNTIDKGGRIPADTINTAANGYYAGKGLDYGRIYAGVNEFGSRRAPTDSWVGIFSVVAVIICLIAAAAYFAIKHRRSVVMVREKDGTDSNGEGSYTANCDAHSEMNDRGAAGLVQETAGIARDVADKYKENVLKDRTAPRSANRQGRGIYESDLQKLATKTNLTSRETDVLREYISGKTRAGIAETLCISESTVKNHISSIFSKLGINNKKELLMMFDTTK